MSPSTGLAVADTPKEFRFGAGIFDQARYELRVGDLPISVERRPLGVLEMLLANAGNVVTHDELLETVWAGRVTVRHVLPNAMAKLRKALGPKLSECIVTQPRIGYRFVGEVESRPAPRLSASGVQLDAGQSVPGAASYRLTTQIDAEPLFEHWLAQCETAPHDIRLFKFTADAGGLALLRHEAQLARTLAQQFGSRTDVAQILGEHFSAPPFYVAYRWGGTPLSEWAPRLATLDRRQRLSLFLQIADVIDVAHRGGILHGAVSAGAVLIDAGANDQPSICVRDFGSQPAGADPSAGATGLQTAYLAPECHTGQPPTVQTDLYALGVLLFQIIIGDLSRKPLAGWQAEIDDALIAEDIGAAIADDPSQRLNAVAELCERLRKLDARHAHGESIQRELGEARSREASWARTQRRQRWLLSGALAMSLLVTVLGLRLLWLQGAARDARADASRSSAVATFWSQRITAAEAASDRSLSDLLEAARANIDADFAGDPAAGAAVHGAIAQALATIGRWPTALEEFERSAEQFERIEGPSAWSVRRARLGQARALLALSLKDDAATLLAHSFPPQEELSRVPGDIAQLASELRAALASAGAGASDAVKEGPGGSLAHLGNAALLGPANE